MTTDITIPPEVVEIAAKAVAAEVKHDWDTAGDFRDKWRAVAIAAIRAGLLAWPGAYQLNPRNQPDWYVLPITENNNDQA